MTSIYPSVSRSELISRRKQLRRQRLIKSLRATWRVILVSGIVGSLYWGIKQPHLVLLQPQQIQIEGNKLLSSSTIRSLLPIRYPQSLLRLQPDAIAKTLEDQPPIAQATVTRKLIPPGLTVQVKERQPVAVAINASLKNASKERSPNSSRIGLLDAQGVWIPLESYKDSQNSLSLPTLKVINFSELYRPYWSQLYQTLSQSPVKILELDCHSPANLVLKTELGKVHLGPLTSHLPEQLKVLDQMRNLSTQVKASEISYIDLQNPNAPSIQVKSES